MESVMKCNPWRWLWGLVPILMLGWIAILGERGRIEADLTQRTKVVLERSGLGWADVTFDGRDAVLSGRAVDEGEPGKAVVATLDTMGVRTVDNRASLVDKVDRYEWTAIRKDNRIRVDGLVASDKIRRDVMGMVRANFPSLEIDDRMKLARGAPPVDVWLGGVGFGLKQLALLRDGRVDLEQTSISVAGDAIDARSYRAVKASLSGKLPQGIRLKSEAVRPPVASPYVWSARRQGKEVLLVGHVPNDTVRDELMRAARRVAPEAKLVDQMEPASGAPDGFVGVAGALMEQLGKLEEGTGQIRDKAATLTGVADTAARADDIKSATGRGALASFRTTGDIRHREPLIKTISPYETAAQVEPGVVVLTGYVPDEKARGAITSLVRQRFAGRRVRDELQLGAGQPQGWEQCLEVGFDALQSLGNGRAALTGRKLSVSGTTDAEPLAQSLPADVRTRAGSVCDADVRVTLDLAALQAREEARRRAEQEAQQKADNERRRREEVARLETERQRAEEAQRLQAEAERRRAEDAARQRSEEENRRADEVNRQRAEEARRQQIEAERRREEEAKLQIAEEESRRQRAEAERRRAEAAAQERAEAERRRAEAAAQERAEAERRRAEVAAQERAERERAEAERAKAEAEKARIASQQPALRQPTSQQTAAQQVVDLCQQAMSKLVREGIINFKRASFDLDPESFPTLNKLAEAANRCPSVTVEIEGHTDAEGTPERNQRLSDRRANSVREYLSRAGVDASRLVAIGYGQERNIAPNDTAEGRAQNRRIEFVVKMR